MGRRPEVIQQTLLQNPRFQNALPDSVIYNTLELTTAWVDGYADLFLFERVSPSAETYAEIPDNLKLGGLHTGTSNVLSPDSSATATLMGMPSTRPSGLFGAVGSSPHVPASSQGASSSSLSSPSSGSTNRHRYARQDPLSDLCEEPMETRIQP